MAHPDLCADAIINDGMFYPKRPILSRATNARCANNEHQYEHSYRQTQKERERDKNYEVDFCSFCSVVLGFKMFGFCEIVFALCTL